jgi:hypothetical protein
MLKHIGKMKNNGAKVVVAYRTLPGDHTHALVIGTGNLGDDYHDDLMSVVQSPEGQQAYELAEILSVRRFRDGGNMLQWFHSRGHLKKVPTSGVLMTPAPQSSVSLDELNELIAKDKGITLEELALTDGKGNVVEKKETKVPVTEPTKELSPAELRSKADALFKEAQSLRKKADELDPPKKKTKKVVVKSDESI